MKKLCVFGQQSRPAGETPSASRNPEKCELGVGGAPPHRCDHFPAGDRLKRVI